MNISLYKYLLSTMCLFSIASFFSIAGANVFLGMSTLLALVILLKNKSYDISCENKHYFNAITVFAGALFASALFSANIGEGLKIWADFFLWRFMPFIIVLFYISKKEFVNKLLSAIYGGFIVSCCYAIYQGIVVYKMNLAQSRATGFSGHPMTLAGLMCILLPVLYIYLFQKDISKKERCVGIGIFIVGCIALVFNSTRGAWLALAIVFPLLSMPFILKSKKLFMSFASIVLAIGIFLTNSTSFMKRVDTFSDFNNNWSNMYRLIMWETAFDMFKHHPILGVGLGNYRNVYKNDYIKPRIEKEQNIIREIKSFQILSKTEQDMVLESPVNLWKVKGFFKLERIERIKLDKVYRNFRFEYGLSKYNHAHNNILQMLAENGVVGLLGYLFAFGYILWTNVKNYFINNNPYALMIVGSTTALMLQGLTEYNFGNSSVMKVYWLVLACLIVLTKWYNEQKDSDKF